MFYVDLHNRKKKLSNFHGTLPPSRSGAASLNVNGKIMIFSGLSSTGLGESILTDCWEFDGNIWKEIRLRGTVEVISAKAEQYGNYVIIVGGISGRKYSGEKQYSNTIYVVDLIKLQVF